MSNIDRAARVLAELCKAGVGVAVVCGGARNAPLVALVAEARGIEVLSFFEERSAAFFALGRIKSRGRPVAVFTTSGTACAELLPAIIEAHYASLPLIVVTSDRPRRFRGSGAPQVIEQVGLYGNYVEQCVDMAADDGLDLSSWSGRAPLHINICFEEPLLDAPVLKMDLSPRVPSYADPPQQKSPNWTSIHDPLEGFLRQVRSPLVIVGEVEPRERDGALAFLMHLGAPVYAEALSQLRENSSLAPLTIPSERLITQAFSRGLCDGILRIGGVPTLRFWRDLEGRFAHVPVLSISSRPFSGGSRSALVHVPEGEGVLGQDMQYTPRGSSRVLDLARQADAMAHLDALCAQYPRSEVALVRKLSEAIPKEALVYLGNSLPIRQWDLVAQRTHPFACIAANRGANGIDGQISTFLGMCAPGRPNWALLGDLTALYDLAAPWAVRHIADVDFTLAVIHNQGGRIFERMFQHPIFLNVHDISLEPWACQWGLHFEACDDIPESVCTTGQRVLEIHPDRQQSQSFWSAYEAQC